MRKRHVLVGGLVLAGLVGAGLLLRPILFPGPDWSALPAVEPVVAAPWEPAPPQSRHLEVVDPCALLRAIDPEIEAGSSGDLSVDSAEPAGEGCRTFPRRDRLEVRLGTGTSAAVVDGTAAGYAYAGEELDLEGFTAWAVPARTARASCAVYLPAGARNGLLVRAEAGWLCGELVERAAAALRAWRTDPVSFARAGETAPDAELPFTPRGELTIRGAGACADLASQWAQRCAEHVGRDVPGDAVDRIRAGEADADVVCTAALDAAEGAGIAGLRAVTAVPLVPDGRRSCVLLATDREWAVWVSTSRDPVGGAGTLTVAGHAASRNPLGAPAYAIALGDPREPGRLEVVFDTTGPGLGEPDWAQALLDALVAKILG